MRKQLIIALISALSATSVSAKAFTNFEEQVFRQNPETVHLQLRELSEQEMKETEGEVAPLVAVGFMTGSRFIAQRYVTATMARNMVRSAGRNGRIAGHKNWGIMANSRSQARYISGNSRIVENHSVATRFKQPKPGNYYTHYHPNPRNGSHVWYGKPTRVR